MKLKDVGPNSIVKFSDGRVFVYNGLIDIFASCQSFEGEDFLYAPISEVEVIGWYGDLSKKYSRVDLIGQNGNTGEHYE